MPVLTDGERVPADDEEEPTKRVLAVAALAVAATPLLAAAPASADPSACLSVDVSVNGTGQSQNICLPPSGSRF